jgi:oligoribonuclease NrnB/cAMP/cGMP phosphodiesterase (DHH superfamily)
MVDVIIYHSADPDGVFSGAIALKANPGARLIGYNYEPDFDHIIEQCRGLKVFMVDVSPHNWADMHRLCGAAKWVTWIDHHASALDEMRKHGTHQEFLNFSPVFETEKWGAAKATWEFFFAGIPMPPVVEMVAGYDAYRDYGTAKWRNEYFPFRFAVSHLRHPEDVLREFELFDVVEGEDGEDVVYYDDATPWLERGKAIALYVEGENAFVANNDTLCFKTFFYHGNVRYWVLVVNKPLFGDMFKSRDMGEYDFAVGFVAHRHEWKVSLRGTGKADIDLGQIAKTFGGGGHKNAAGFSVADFEALKQVIYLDI